MFTVDPPPQVQAQVQPAETNVAGAVDGKHAVRTVGFKLLETPKEIALDYTASGTYTFGGSGGGDWDYDG